MQSFYDSDGDSSCSMKQYTEETAYFEDGAFNDINSPSPLGATHGAGTLGNAFPPPTPLHSPNPETPLHSPNLQSPELHSPPSNQFGSPKPERTRAISTSSFADSGASIVAPPPSPPPSAASILARLHAAFPHSCLCPTAPCQSTAACNLLADFGSGMEDKVKYHEIVTGNHERTLQTVAALHAACLSSHARATASLTAGLHSDSHILALLLETQAVNEQCEQTTNEQRQTLLDVLERSKKALE